METIIKVEDLSKQYRIGAKEGYKTFRETLVDSAKAPFLLCKEIGKRVFRHQPHAPGSIPSSQSDEYIWALKDVSFEVEQGEVLGIIGRNGAGKSTLLKVLSKITEPTKGRVELKGRVGSLLEVGTGFHPELTGHENVYLYGAILGMDRWEVSRKFDEIIAFAELEKFVDTPVKRYSSGMYMRLAFAVAAHLEPEILLVDEVLAVGDAAFQKKCLGKMGDVSREGRTVLFVSHNMGAIQRLCNQCILLDFGQIVKEGDAHGVIETYLSTGKQEQSGVDLEEIPRVRELGSRARINRCYVYDAAGKPTNALAFGEPFVIQVSCRVFKPLEEVSFLVGIDSIYEQRIATITSLEAGETFSAGPGEVVTGRLEVKDFLLKPGIYTLTLGLFATNLGIDRVPNCTRIEVSDISFSQRHVHVGQVTVGMIQIPDPAWQIKIESAAE